MENQFLIDSEYLSAEALEKKHRLETDPSSRKSHMEYMPGMEQITSDVMEKVMSQMNSYDYEKYTAKDVKAALEHETCSIEDFKALLSPAAAPFLEQMAQKAKIETSKHFGNTVYLFTPLYIANYCENYCVYCGFNCYNHINRMQLNMEQIAHEMKVIADSGMEEILILTGESRAKSDVKYIGEACKLARKYFRMVGLEIYPVNTNEYRYLHECGADYVTVFQETYDSDKYETLHLMGHKRVWPYRFEAQERALMAGMRGAGFSALLGLSDFRKDALASALHVYYLQRKYPQAELSLSCPRLRPIINNDKINPLDVGEKQLCQVLCAYRIFLPFVGITVSSRESEIFRNGIVKIAATKVSAGKRRNQNSTKDLKQQLIKNGTYQNRDYQGKTFEKKNTTGGEFNSILKNSVMEKSDILCITNRKLCKDDFLKRIQIIAAAQPKAIVLREKDLSEEAYTILAEKVMHICEKYSVPCILHSFAKAAMALNVKAIHMPLPLLRKMTPQEKNHFEIIGASCHSLEEAKEAERLGCTYITAGHIFLTDCKKGLPGRGLTFLQNICENVSIPVYAIGGISNENINDVRQTGAAGACIMSGFMKCNNIAEII